MLRHGCGYYLANKGYDLRIIQDYLGHKNVQTTLQTYVHNTETMEQQAVDIFEKAVNHDLPTM